MTEYALKFKNNALWETPYWYFLCPPVITAGRKN